MSRFPILVTTSALVVGALFAVPATIANAETIAVQSGWGENDYGWKVNIHNATQSDLRFNASESLHVRKMKSYDELLVSQTHELQGRIGPSYKLTATYVDKDGVERAVHVSKTGILCGKVSYPAYGKKIDNKNGCAIVQNDLQNRIEVRFVDFE